MQVSNIKHLLDYIHYYYQFCLLSFTQSLGIKSKRLVLMEHVLLYWPDASSGAVESLVPTASKHTFHLVSDSGARFCHQSVCLCPFVCLSVFPLAYLKNHSPIFSKFFVHVTYGHGSVLL